MISNLIEHTIGLYAMKKSNGQDRVAISSDDNWIRWPSIVNLFSFSCDTMNPQSLANIRASLSLC